MTCGDSDEVGGTGCVLLPGHPGDHETIEGAPFPRLIEQDCPECGALKYSVPPGDNGLPCPACQEES